MDGGRVKAPHVTPVLLDNYEAKLTLEQKYPDSLMSLDST